jgi:hypothetical protein
MPVTEPTGRNIVHVLREGLRAEVPAVFDLAARARRPAVGRMSPALAAVGALGVESLTFATIRTAQSVGLYISGNYLVRNTEPLTVLGYALAMVFAFGAARWRGAAAALALFAVMWIEQFWLSAPGRQAFCDRSGTPCDLAAIDWPQLWPQLLGIALGLLAVRAVRQGGPRIAALALGIGVFALSFSIGRLAFVPFLGLAPVGEAAGGAINTVIGVQLLGALTAGLMIGAFGKRHVTDALVLVVYFIGPWSPQLRAPDLFYGPFILAIEWQFFVPVGYALVAVVGLAIGAAAARYRATRMPTIP